jgi:NAD(P)H-dependent FMN reductase
MSLATAVIYGSARRSRQGINAARFIVKQLTKRGHEVELIDSNQFQLPMLDLMYKEYEPGQAPPAMEHVASVLRNADGFIVVSGEYNHSVPAALKNLLDHFQSEYHYKPSGIVTYSAGPFGGVRNLVNLRGILAELGTPAIPSAFPVMKIQSAIDEEGNALDANYEKFVVKFLDEFEWYARALKVGREGEHAEQDFPVQQALCREA